MKRWTVKQIGGIEFEFDNKTLCPVTTGDIPSYSDIFQFYNRPSIFKQQIWNSWVDWFRENSENSTDWMEISSYNVNFFSISAQITVGQTRYNLYITRCHYKAMEVAR